MPENLEEKSKPKKLKSIMKRSGTLIVTLGFVALAVGAVGFGQSVLSERAQAVEKPPATEPLSVSVSQIRIDQSYTVSREFTGQIEAPQSADISFEQGGIIQEVLVDEGNEVKKGQILALLDDRLLRAEVNRLNASKDALAAQLELARLTNDRQEKLKDRGFATAQTADQTRLSIKELEARMMEMDAMILSAEIRLEKAKIFAPFDGKVSQRNLDPGNTVGQGQSVVAIVESGSPVFRVGVDPRLAETIALGDLVKVSLVGAEYDARIIGVLPQVDSVTRTRIIRAELETDNALAFGETGRLALLEEVKAEGAWVPLSALEDGVRGLWSLKTIEGDREPIVALEAVELIHADTTQAFVRGSFKSGTRYINDGVHRVVTGQPVRVIE